jgi:hypothetical protein
MKPKLVSIQNNLESGNMQFKDEQRMGKMINTYTILVGRREGNVPLGRLRQTLKNNIKTDHKEI